MDPININNLSLPNSKNLSELKSKRPPRHRQGEKFLKGPIPWKWIVRAAYLSGKALHVAIAIWFLAGIGRNRIIKLSNKVVIALGISRFAKGRALKELERAGLVAIKRNNGSSPLITILEVTKDEREE